MSSSPSFRVAIKPNSDTDFGYLISPDKPVHRVVTEVTLRVIDIMMNTDLAKNALQSLAQKWAVHWDQPLNDMDHVIAGFRILLRAARLRPEKWPLIVVDWTMDKDTDAYFASLPDAMNASDLHYALEHNRIHINGVVSRRPILSVPQHLGNQLTQSTASTSSCTRYKSEQPRAECPQI